MSSKRWRRIRPCPLSTCEMTKSYVDSNFLMEERRERCSLWRVRIHFGSGKEVRGGVLAFRSRTAIKGDRNCWSGGSVAVWLERSNWRSRCSLRGMVISIPGILGGSYEILVVEKGNSGLTTLKGAPGFWE